MQETLFPFPPQEDRPRLFLLRLSSSIGPLEHLVFSPSSATFWLRSRRLHFLVLYQVLFSLDFLGMVGGVVFRFPASLCDNGDGLRPPLLSFFVITFSRRGERRGPGLAYLFPVPLPFPARLPFKVVNRAIFIGFQTPHGFHVRLYTLGRRYWSLVFSQPRRCLYLFCYFGRLLLWTVCCGGPSLPTFPQLCPFFSVST